MHGPPLRHGRAVHFTDGHECPCPAGRPTPVSRVSQIVLIASKSATRLVTLSPPGGLVVWHTAGPAAPDGGYTTLVSGIDLLVLGGVALSAFRGAQRGLVATLLGLAGFAVGAIIGSRLAPLLLQGGRHSPWLGVAGLIGALVGGSIVQVGAGAAANALRAHVLHGPLAAADTAGGVAAGVVLGLAIAWLVAVVALEQPGLHLRRNVQRSTILPALLRAVPASTVLDALARFDPLPVVPAIADRALDPPTPPCRTPPGPHAARASVVRVQGTACGLGIQGSGWVVTARDRRHERPRDRRRARHRGAAARHPGRSRPSRSPSTPGTTWRSCACTACR